MRIWINAVVALCVLWTFFFTYQNRSAVGALLAPQPEGAALARQCVDRIEYGLDLDGLAEKCVFNGATQEKVILYDQAQGRALGKLRTSAPTWIWGVLGILLAAFLGARVIRPAQPRDASADS